MYPWYHSFTTKINKTYDICGNTWALVASFVSEDSWILPSCVDFNTAPFVSWTRRDRIDLFLFINGVFGNTNVLVAPVSNIALCEDGGYQIGCYKIILVLF